ncbi:F-box/kelch-repeat protein At3g23880-like [Spinacia oleracea]|uniref:F-box/kelch-repeat protein At3g23880-like n=1 Tax=Spinacia oleracea TaxID=3562 RepID=A0ABM3RNC8_SPIOL|nr:F-box/kelch-repeat protein At3g23880-like [Spinacia oleracea]
MENDENERQIPKDLMIQPILPRLPVKHLARSKLVRKKCNSSISSTNFTLHYTKQPLISHPSFPVQSLFVQDDKTFYLYSCENDDNVGQKNLVKLDVDFSVNSGEVIELIGCSNGLVCLAEIYGKFFFLYNPATSQSHKFYPGDFEIWDPSYTNWGFGYDSINDDFKVVRIMTNGVTQTVHVYSLKMNVWRKVDFGVERSRGFLFEKAVFVNDTLYWTMMVTAGSTLTARLVAGHKWCQLE